MFRNLVLGLATVAAGLVAGLFYAFSYSVMPGLREVDDRAFIDAMQQINVAILNGWFLICFVGALVLTALAAGLHLRADGRPALIWIIAGLVLYIAALGITGAVNVPLNDALAAAGEPGGITDPAAVRQAFEATWVTWNIARAVASVAALACLVIALGCRGPARVRRPG